MLSTIYWIQKYYGLRNKEIQKVSVKGDLGVDLMMHLKLTIIFCLFIEGRLHIVLRYIKP